MTMTEEKMASCAEHPEKAEIFRLEQMLDEAEFPYFFNYREDLRPTPFGQMPPESINWDSYIFLIEVGHLAGSNLSDISITFNKSGDKKLLQLLDMRPAAGMENPTAKDGELSFGLTAETCMDVIRNYYDSM